MHAQAAHRHVVAGGYRRGGGSSGPREVADGTVALRRGAERHAATLDTAVAELVAACAPPWAPACPG